MPVTPQPFVLLDAPERWLPVPDFEGYFEASDQGRVRSLPRPRSSGRLLRQRLTVKGYARVKLCRDGEQREYFVHRLVASAFVGPLPAGMEVRHGPGGNGDNRAVNLSYGTSAQNKADKLRDGTAQRGERNPSARLSAEHVREIRQRYAAGGVSQRALAAEYGVSQTAIYDIAAGRRWSSAA